MLSQRILEILSDEQGFNLFIPECQSIEIEQRGTKSEVFAFILKSLNSEVTIVYFPVTRWNLGCIISEDEYIVAEHSDHVRPVEISRPRSQVNSFWRSILKFAE